MKTIHMHILAGKKKKRKVYKACFISISELALSVMTKLQSCTSTWHFLFIVLIYFEKENLKTLKFFNICICLFLSESIIVFVSLPQLLIGYENGTVVLWDLRSKRADLRAYYDEVSNFH